MIVSVAFLEDTHLCHILFDRTYVIDGTCLFHSETTGAFLKNRKHAATRQSIQKLKEDEDGRPQGSKDRRK